MLNYNSEQNSSVNTAPTVPAQPVIDIQQNIKDRLEQAPKRKWWPYALLVFILVLLGSGGWWYYAKGQVMLLAKDMTWQWGTNYKMSQKIQIKLANIADLLGQNFTDADLKLDSFMDVIGTNLEGQADLSFSSNKESANFILKYKKIDKTVYLGVESQDEWLKMIPVDLNSTWLSLDQESIQSNPLLQGKPNDYMPNFKDWSEKNNAFLQTLKDQKLVILSDPHQTKEVAGTKLKKIDFKINPDKVSEFWLASIDAFADASKAIEMKKNFETYKTDEPENWASMQELVKTVTFVFWVDTKSKSIQGIDFVVDNFDLKSKNEHLFNLTLNFSQTIESIEAKEISAPETVMSLEDLMNVLMSGMTSAIPVNSECQDFNDPECAVLMTDLDSDGLSDMEENALGTNPAVADTDGDGYKDGEEVKNGYNPFGEGKLDMTQFTL